ncbi:DUF2199 domain-containing protein [Lapillicoccus sp.]|uniref:DUF2199 domain-containing protein n=1 Tax=Lapillicoccus sp. TaxID=1909287 RepID=UPI00398371D4
MALRESEEGWVCRECGRTHVGLITCFGPDAPLAWHRASLPARLLGRRSRSFCRVKTNGQWHFCVRGHLRIPLTGHADPFFIWNVWVEVSEPDFRALTRTLADPRRVAADPVKGTLETDLPYTTLTSGLAVEIHNRPPGEVPHVRITRAAGHPLQAEQEAGIDTHRLAQLNSDLLASAGP